MTPTIIVHVLNWFKQHVEGVQGGGDLKGKGFMYFLAEGNAEFFVVKTLRCTLFLEKIVQMFRMSRITPASSRAVKLKIEKV